MVNFPGKIGIRFDHGIDREGAPFPDLIDFVGRTVTRFEPVLGA